MKKINDNETIMKQSNLIRKIERNFEMDMYTSRTYQTSVGANESILRPTSYKLKISEDRKSKHRSGVGMLLYLIKYSRPDISNSVRKLSKVNDGATEAH